MNKIQARCYRGYGLAGRRRNIDVRYALPDFGYFTRLFTDLRTGEIYAVEDDGRGLSVEDVNRAVEGLQCPVTGQPLAGHLTPYPESFMFEGQVGHFEPSNYVPPDAESSVCEFWEITPPAR
jgi:hypothetical protein